MQHLRIPPQSIESEQALLGSIMLRPEGMYEVVDFIRPECFYSDKHRVIYATMLELFTKREPIDLLSVSTKMKEHGTLENAGGMTYLTELAQAVPSSANIRHYAHVVQKKFMMRELIAASDFIANLGYDEAQDLDDLLDRAEKKMYDITNQPGSKNFISIKELAAEARERLASLHENRDKLRGVPTGFRDLDNLIAGFQPSDLIVLAARPSVGKTALALDFARHAALRENVPVGIFSLEMSNQQLVDRIVAAEAYADAWRVRTGHPTNEEFNNISETLTAMESAPLFIDDQAGNRILSMRSEARRLKSQHGLGLLIVDYLQLIMPPSGRANDSLVQQVTEISRSLKIIAKELEVPVLALSQLSREIEKRGGQPRLSDLRESGSIEQDADLVLFIHKKVGGDIDERKEPHDADIIVAKHRNGPPGKVTLKFHPKQATFRQIEHHRDDSF